VIALGLRQDGQREVLGFDVGTAETYEFWAAFLRALVRRGLRGVRLVISDAHEGLRRALVEILVGASWQPEPGCTSCATCSSACPSIPMPWRRLWCALSSPSLITSPPVG